MTKVAPTAKSQGPAAVRARLHAILRRDLIGPGRNDPDLATELLSERPGRWYLTGFLVPTPDAGADPSVTDPAAELGDPAEMGDPLPGGGRPEDEGEAELTPARRILQPSSLGLTVQVPVSARHLTVALTWGDYTTEPPMAVLELEETGRRATHPNWRRHPRSATVRSRDS